MALLPLASGSEARGFWASTAASSIRRVVRRRSPSSASANSWTAQVVSSTRLLIRRSCVQGVIIGRIQGFHALSIPQDTRKQKLWVTGRGQWRACMIMTSLDRKGVALTLIYPERIADPTPLKHPPPVERPARHG